MAANWILLCNAAYRQQFTARFALNRIQQLNSNMKYGFPKQFVVSYAQH
jgi:hypothetical protein